MAIGIVSTDELFSELNKSKEEVRPPISKVEIVDKPPKGRGVGNTEVPDPLRKLIGEESVINGRQSALDLAKLFDISPSSVSAYAVGSTSTASYNTPSPSLKSYLDKSRARHSKKAQRVLSQALSSITPGKLEELDPKDAAGIAKDMSVIIKNLEPPADVSEASQGNKGGVNFTIYAPQFRDERTFPTIKLEE